MVSLTKKQCEEWELNHSRNPATGRKIHIMGPTYRRIERDCALVRDLKKEDCDKWRRNPTRHPLTGRKLRAGGKTHGQLVKLCNPSAPKKSASIEKKRAKLVSVVRRAVAPILNKGDTTKSRVQFANIIRKYLGAVEPCLHERDKKMWLLTAAGEPVVFFDKRIGSESVYGVAYMNMGKGLAKMLRFSCKLMSKDVDGHAQEIKLLRKMSDLVEAGQSPNMPVTYLSLTCRHKCDMAACPENTKKGGYYVVINELADSDIQTWFRKTYSAAVYESVLMQVIMSIYTFHNLGYTHNDCHLGNFLVHRIKPGGCWRYRVGDRDVYVPNHGYLVVMWDPGLAKKTAARSWAKDYQRALGLIAYMHEYAEYMKAGMKPLPPDIITRCILPLYNALVATATGKEDVAMENVVDEMEDAFPSVKVGGVPPDHLLNIKPYHMAKRV